MQFHVTNFILKKIEAHIFLIVVIRSVLRVQSMLAKQVLGSFAEIFEKTGDRLHKGFNKFGKHGTVNTRLKDPPCV